jgi:hypothetical protein
LYRRQPISIRFGYPEVSEINEKAEWLFRPACINASAVLSRTGQIIGRPQPRINTVFVGSGEKYIPDRKMSGRITALRFAPELQGARVL